MIYNPYLPLYKLDLELWFIGKIYKFQSAKSILYFLEIFKNNLVWNYHFASLDFRVGSLVCLLWHIQDPSCLKIFFSKSRFYGQKSCVFTVRYISYQTCLKILSCRQISLNVKHRQVCKQDSVILIVLPVREIYFLPCWYYNINICVYRK